MLSPTSDEHPDATYPFRQFPKYAHGARVVRGAPPNLWRHGNMDESTINNRGRTQRRKGSERTDEGSDGKDGAAFTEVIDSNTSYRSVTLSIERSNTPSCNASRKTALASTDLGPSLSRPYLRAMPGTLPDDALPLALPLKLDPDTGPAAPLPADTAGNPLMA